MALFGRKAVPEPPDRGEPAGNQIRTASDHPFSQAFNSYKPLQHNLGLFRTIREAIPPCNAAVSKIVKLIGIPELKSQDKRTQAVLDEVTNDIKVNSFDRGITSYISQMADSALSLGGGVGEIVPAKSLKEIHHLTNHRTEDLKFALLENGEYTYASGEGVDVKPVQYPELITYCTFDKRDGHPQGYSLFYSLPYVTQVLLRMEKAIENMSWRVGDPIFFTLITGAEGQKPAEVKASSASISSAIKSAFELKRSGKPADVYGAVPYGGKAEVSAMGADFKAPIMEVHIRTIMEQIVSQLQVPPGLFGFQWSVAERMIEYQTDMFVSFIEGCRKQLTYPIKKIVDFKLIFAGLSGAEYELEWPAVNIKSEKDDAATRLNNAQAQEIEIRNYVQLVGLGAMSQDDANQMLVDSKIVKRKPAKEWWSAKIAEMLALKAMQGIFYVKE